MTTADSGEKDPLKDGIRAHDHPKQPPKPATPGTSPSRLACKPLLHRGRALPVRKTATQHSGKLHNRAHSAEIC